MEMEEFSSEDIGSVDSQNGEGALRMYSQRFRRFGKDDRSNVLFNHQPFNWKKCEMQAQKYDLDEEGVRAELGKELGLKVESGQDGSKGKSIEVNFQRKRINGKEVRTIRMPPRTVACPKGCPKSVLGSAEGSDNENDKLCVRCGLPLGDTSYAVDDVKYSRAHGECIVKQELKDLRKEDTERLKKEAALKNSRRKQFGIGWKVESVPRNIGIAKEMGCQFDPQGMCCLVLQEATHTVNVVPTLEPAGSINLAYLSIALKVRHQEGREPLFSLDPLDVFRSDDSMQVKRFEPEWLAGTCVGDVLFQADYYLKELSMGEYEQPVVGMKSCLDYSFKEEHDENWRAREWFVVRKAEVHLSEDDVLIPFVKMGVEAREQVVDSDSNLFDALITRQDHPLMLYAQSFTKNFDLIAERKSVVFHLRELANASVLAKYLCETELCVPQNWLEITGLTTETLPRPESLKIPQLWNSRAYSKIRVKDGTIVHNEWGRGTSRHGMYGGVHFGLDRFNITRSNVPRVAFQGVPTAPMHEVLIASQSANASQIVRHVIQPARRAEPKAAIEAQPGARAPRRAGAPKRRARRGPPGAQIQRREAPEAIQRRPQGVDLSLDNFDLNMATRVASQEMALEMGQDACSSIGTAFWANVDSSDGSEFKDQDRVLLADLFNPFMSDRRDEKDRFVPPVTSKTYVEKLSSLMKDEGSVRSARKTHFFSKKFSIADPGSLFPSSWKNYIEIDRRAPVSLQDEVLHERPDYMVEAEIFRQVIQSTPPAFDKKTEEGMRFRVYHIGSVEVRTIQEVDGKEVVGAIFSKGRAPNATMNDKELAKIQGSEKVVKITMHVERDRRLHTSHRYYIVLETDVAGMMVTEMHSDGTVTWKDNPANLEVRNFLSKTFRAMDCCDKGITVEDMKIYSSIVVEQKIGGGASQSTGRRYAQEVYDWTIGKTQNVACFTVGEPSLVRLPSTGVAQEVAREIAVWERLAKGEYPQKGSAWHDMLEAEEQYE